MRSASLFAALLLVSTSVFATDNRREQDFAADIQPQLSLGQAIWLKSADKTYLALYTEAEKTDNSQVVILLHDMGEHPDAKPLIHRFRTTLPMHNWATLALQMPIRESGAPAEDYYPLFDEARGRIDAAVEHLLKNGAKHIAIVGYGMGALMAAYRLGDKPNDVMALVSISLPVPQTTASPAQSLNLIKKVQLPFLDVYAEFDLPTVLDSARQRRMAGKDNPVYRQIRMDGEDHGYHQDYDLLVKRVYSWLTTTVSEN
jgi:pimeloyl-ACP methyl ester carboxylesterase